MIPLGPTDIGRYARVVADCDNGRSGPPGRSLAATRWLSAGDIVRILDWRPATGTMGTVGPGLARVIVARDGALPESLTTSAYNLELVDPPRTEAWTTGPGRVVMAPDGKLYLTDVHARRLQSAHAEVAAAYATLADALTSLRHIEKETER